MNVTELVTPPGLDRHDLSEFQQDLFEAIVSSQAHDYGLGREEVIRGLIALSQNRGYITGNV